MNDVPIDNQQVTETEWAWIAGYLDGEGSFGIYGTRRKDNSLNYGARVQVASVDAISIKKMVDICSRYNVSCRIWNRLTKNPKHRDAVYTTVNRLSSLYLFLPKIIPYLSIKKPHAELLFSWVKSRVRKGINKGGNTKKSIYNDKELGLVQRLKIINGSGTSQTIREDLVRQV